ncbi:MAG: putative rane protein [Glaciihabitans sp.]|jgi:hypothetical protein|nr:putative rane protein [Glaciihabitans sp.]MDQ1570013.1 hypothetical protein [Actinomycetota bacterium]
MHDDEPELAGYEPSDNKPLRSRGLLLMMRVVVVVGVLALVLPGVVTTFSVAATSAKEACRRWVAYADPASPGSSARFELFGAGGVGWECYTRGSFGGDRHVASLGLIPGPPRLPSRQPSNS